MTDLTGQAANLLENVHANVIRMYRQLDPSADENTNELETSGGGVTKPHVFAGGEKIEKAAALFTRSHGSRLPEAASTRNPEFAGQPFSAVSISTISHPRNPHIPSAHMNLRFFQVAESQAGWYFGGGLDLTPHIPYAEDCVLWHQRARNACVDIDQYHLLKRQCDQYFHLPHRNEHRGIGGLFFDDWTEGSFQDCLALTRRVGDSFVSAYQEIFSRRVNFEWSEEEEEWMLLRRGRYVEFNLLYDRGTKYGIQSGRRIESVLASLPPRVRWQYDQQPTTDRIREISDSLNECLQPKDWIEVE